ncbi:MAG: response regulator [Proteobacteria bacterium]|nr:response regulator [Pseudomonadota bacterium]
MLHSMVSEDISIERVQSHDLWKIEADSTRVEQVITNLIVNSSYAMPNGGKVTLGTKNVTLTLETVPSVQGTEPGNFVCPTVSLSMPVAEVQSTQRAAGGEGRRILLVEDDEWVRRSTAMLLTQYGYTVFEASGGDMGIDLFSKEAGEFALVLSDVVMPGMSGLELVVRLRETKPSIPVLFMSGYVDNKAHFEQIKEGGFVYIQKPYDMYDLLRSIENGIDGAS